MSEWSLKSKIANVGAKGPFDVDGSANTIVFTTERIDQVQTQTSIVNIAKGVVKVFLNLSGEWTQLGQDIETDYYQTNPVANFATDFGYQVKISEDGTVIAIGEPGYSISYYNQATDSYITSKAFCGRVQVYKLVGTNWVQLGQDLIPQGQSIFYRERFGNVISLSPDGKTLAVGSPGSKTGGFAQDYGNIKIYEFNEANATWQQLGSEIWNSSYLDRIANPSARLYDDGIANLPESIEISNNKDLIVGRPLFGPSIYNYQGKAELYKYSNSTNWAKTYTYDYIKDGYSKVGQGVSITKDGSIFSVLLQANQGYISVFSKTENPNSVLFPKISILTLGGVPNGPWGAKTYYDFSVIGNYSRGITYESHSASIVSEYSDNNSLTWTRYETIFDPSVTVNTAKLSKETSTLVVIRNDFNIYIYDPPPPPPSATPTPTITATSTPVATTTPTKTGTPTPTQTPTLTATTTETPTPTPTETKCKDIVIGDGVASVHEYDIQNTGSLEDANGGTPLLGNGGEITARGYEFLANQGLTVSESLLDTTQYSISIDFNIENTSYPIKIVDFKNRLYNNGIYYLPTSQTTGKINLRFEPVNNFVSDVVVNANTRNRLTLVRTLRINPIVGNVLSRTPIFKVLLNNIVLFEVEDNEDFSVPDNNLIQLFIDDIFTSTESGSGVVYKVATYDIDITSQECYLQSLPTPTPTVTSSATPTPTNTETPLPTIPLVTQSLTPFPTSTPSHTPTTTETPTQTASPGASPTATISATPTETPTLTPTATPTQTLSPTVTPSVTVTKTRVSRFARGLNCCLVDLSPTPTASVTASVTQTPTHTPTNTATPTQTPTNTATQTQTPTNTASQTQTPTKTPTYTPTQTTTQTSGLTPTPTQTPTTTTTLTATPTQTQTQTTTTTLTSTPTPTSPGVSEFKILIEGGDTIENGWTRDTDLLTSTEADDYDWKSYKNLAFEIPYGIDMEIVYPWYSMDIQMLQMSENTITTKYGTTRYLTGMRWVDIPKENYRVSRQEQEVAIHIQKLNADILFDETVFKNRAGRFVVFRINGSGYINFRIKSGSLYVANFDGTYRVRLKGNDTERVKYYGPLTASEAKVSYMSLSPTDKYDDRDRITYRDLRVAVCNSALTHIIKFPDVIPSQNIYNPPKYREYQYENQWLPVQNQPYLAMHSAYNLVSVPDNLPGTVTSIRRIFSHCPRINDPNISKWNTENITDMAHAFRNCNSFNLNLNNWNTSNVTNMSHMFAFTKKFNNGNESHQYANMTWDTSNVTNMSFMFAYAKAFNQILNNWNVSSVTNPSYMFFSASLFNTELSNWITSNFTTTSHMFAAARNFNKDINNWDVSKVTDMSNMFAGAISFNKTLVDWNVANVSNMSGMFRNCHNFNQDISRWNVEKVVTMDEMFRDAFRFNQNIGLWNTSSLETAKYMFYTGLFQRPPAFKQSLLNWDISNIIPLTAGSVGVYSSGFDEFLTGVDIGTENYTATLNSWSQKPKKPNGMVDFGLAKKNADSKEAFIKFLSEDYWTIKDGDGINDFGST